MKRKLALLLALVCGVSCAYATRHILTEGSDPVTTESAVRIDYDPAITAFGIITESNSHFITENNSRLVLEAAP